MDRLRELFEQYRYYVIGGGALVLVLVLGGAWLLKAGVPASEPTASFNSGAVTSSSGVSSTISQVSGTSVTSSSSNGGTAATIMVDIKGAVKTPGVYQASGEDRVTDLIERAGGLLKTADFNAINLAQRLSDQQVVYVPRKGEHHNAQLTGNTSGSDQSNGSQVPTENGKININTADKAKLQTINGVGDKKADSIIKFREQKGGFKSIEDIKDVDGFGDKTFENIKDHITI